MVTGDFLGRVVPETDSQSASSYLSQNTASVTEFNRYQSNSVTNSGDWLLQVISARVQRREPRRLTKGGQKSKFDRLGNFKLESCTQICQTPRPLQAQKPDRLAIKEGCQFIPMNGTDVTEGTDERQCTGGRVARTGAFREAQEIGSIPGASPEAAPAPATRRDTVRAAKNDGLETHPTGRKLRRRCPKSHAVGGMRWTRLPSMTRMPDWKS
jgi:hypothetical protein